MQAAVDVKVAEWSVQYTLEFVSFCLSNVYTSSGAQGMSLKYKKAAFEQKDCRIEQEMQRLKEKKEDSQVDEEMEGEEAGYQMKMDEVKNDFSRPTRVGMSGGKVEDEVDKAAFELAT